MLGLIIALLRFKKRLLQPKSDNLADVEVRRGRPIAAARAGVGLDDAESVFRKTYGNWPYTGNYV